VGKLVNKLDLPSLNSSEFTAWEFTTRDRFTHCTSFNSS
jgi:hypothetical protein